MKKKSRIASVRDLFYWKEIGEISDCEISSISPEFPVFNPSYRLVASGRKT